MEECQKDFWYVARHADKRVCDMTICRVLSVIFKGPRVGIWVKDEIEGKEDSLDKKGRDLKSFFANYKRITKTVAKHVLRLADGSWDPDEDKEKSLERARTYVLSLTEHRTCKRKKGNGVANGTPEQLSLPLQNLIHRKDYRILEEHTLKVLADTMDDFYKKLDQVDADIARAAATSRALRENLERFSQLLAPILPEREYGEDDNNDTQKESKKNGRILSVLRESGTS